MITSLQSRIAFFLGSILFFTGLNAQNVTPGQPVLNNRGCGTGTLPAQYETWVQSITPLPGKGNTGNQVQSVFNIPVIVHVIHNNEVLNSVSATSGGNLNAAQIIDQINILNKDFNAKNTDTSLIPAVFKPRKGNFQFNFCLAVVNPTGGVLAEPGIDRINRLSKSWTAPPYTTSYITNTIKPASIWDPTRYLNIWVCPISGGILGYATFPAPGTSSLQGLTGNFGTNTTDGLVMRNNSFGSIGTAQFGAYNKGRTATHELGHWLGLRHIWGDGTCASDYCADTPPAQNANYNCPTHPYKLGTCSGNTTGEMTMNYMDYTNDACMYMFSNDQKNRAQLIMTHSPMRASLLTSTVCNLPTATNDIGILYVISPTYSQSVNCNASINPSIRVHNYGSNNITSATYSYNVDAVNTQTAIWSGTLLPGSSATVNLPAIQNLSNGSHTLNVGFYAPNGNADASPLNNYNSQVFSIVNAFTVGISHSGAACASVSSTLTASGSATGYTWNPGTLTGTQIVISPASTTIYTLSATNGSCVNTRTISVAVLPAPTLSVNAPLVCAGSSTVLNASGACSYTWMPGGITGASLNVSPGSTTVYTLTGAGCNGCGAVKTTTVTVGPPPVITITVSPSGSLCPGGTATLTASGAGSFSWNTGATSSQLVVSPSTSTGYTVTGTTGGCVGTGSAMVTTGSGNLVLTITPNPATVCAGSAIVLTGNGGSTYTWSTGSNAPSLSVTPAVSTSYSVSGTNGACSASAIVNVSVLPVPVLQVQSSAGGSVCAGSSVTLTAAGALSYQWDSGALTPAVVVSPTVTNTYTVTGNSNGCIDTETISVTVGGQTNLILSASASQVCAGASVSLSASGATSYTWMNGSGGPFIVVNPSVTSTYSVTGDQNGCPGSAAISITVTAAPAVSVTAYPSTSLCTGQTATLVASGPYNSFNWGALNNATFVITPSGNTSYLVSGTGNAVGCTGSGSIAVIISPAPLSILSSSNTICLNACSGILNVSSSGGVPPYTYNLSSNTTSLAAGTCSTMPCTNLCQGFYTLRTIDSLGCTGLNFFSIECNPNTGMEELSAEALMIFPNPAQTEFTILFGSGTFAFRIHNQLGQTVKADQAESGRAVISTADLASGIYLVEIKTNERTLYRKIVVE